MINLVLVEILGGTEGDLDAVRPEVHLIVLQVIHAEYYHIQSHYISYIMSFESNRPPCESNGSSLEVLNEVEGTSHLDIFDWSSVDSISDMSR